MILDLEMPVLSGAEVAMQVRAAGGVLPLMVVVSGNAQALGASQGVVLPVSDRAFGKPLRLDLLLAFLVERAGLMPR